MNAKLIKCLQLLAPCSALTCIVTYVVHAQLAHVRPTASGSKTAAFDHFLATNMTPVQANQTGSIGMLRYRSDTGAANSHKPDDPTHTRSQKEWDDIIMASGSKSAPVFDFRTTHLAPLRPSQETATPTTSLDHSADIVASSSKSMAVFNFRPPSTGELARAKYVTKGLIGQTNIAAQRSAPK